MHSTVSISASFRPARPGPGNGRPDRVHVLRFHARRGAVQRRAQGLSPGIRNFPSHQEDWPRRRSSPTNSRPSPSPLLEGGLEGGQFSSVVARGCSSRSKTTDTLPLRNRDGDDLILEVPASMALMASVCSSGQRRPAPRGDPHPARSGTIPIGAFVRRRPDLAVKKALGIREREPSGAPSIRRVAPATAAGDIGVAETGENRHRRGIDGSQRGAALPLHRSPSPTRERLETAQRDIDRHCSYRHTIRTSSTMAGRSSSCQ